MYCGSVLPLVEVAFCGERFLQAYSKRQLAKQEAARIYLYGTVGRHLYPAVHSFPVFVLALVYFLLLRPYPTKTKKLEDRTTNGLLGVCVWVC